MSFRKNLTRIRKRKKISQARLAEKMGISRPLVCQVERGHRKAYPKFIKEASKALDVPLEDLTLK